MAVAIEPPQRRDNRVLNSYELPMSIRRAMPDIRSAAMEESRDFYGLLGFEEVEPRQDRAGRARHQR